MKTAGGGFPNEFAMTLRPSGAQEGAFWGKVSRFFQATLALCPTLRLVNGGHHGWGGRPLDCSGRGGQCCTSHLNSDGISRQNSYQTCGSVVSPGDYSRKSDRSGADITKARLQGPPHGPSSRSGRHRQGRVKSLAAKVSVEAFVLYWLRHVNDEFARWRARARGVLGADADVIAAGRGRRHA